MNSKFYVVFASCLLLLITLVYEGSYAYFTATNTTTGNTTTITQTTDTLEDIVLAGKSSITSSLLIPGESVTTTFTVVNKNKSKACYLLKWSNVSNTFVNQTDLVYSLKGDISGTIVSEVQFPSTNATTTIKNQLEIPANSTETFTLTVTYKNTTEDQTEDMGKSFTATIIPNASTCS